MKYYNSKIVLFEKALLFNSLFQGTTIKSYFMKKRNYQNYY